MEQSANLQLPYIMPSQAQKHVTHNEAIRVLDALVHLAVLDRDLTIPPGSPADGDRYLVAAGGAGSWTGKDGTVAAWQDGAWAFLAPKAGWLLWVADESRLMDFDGMAWIDAAIHSVNPAPLVGVNAIADATNRLAVKSPSSLFDEEAGDHRIKINKAAAGDTASLIFQSGYSGRAELGLAGDDDWHVKVSPNGVVWTEALKVDRATGRVSLPAALPLGDENQVVTRRHVREVLASNRTYYVRTDGSDSNDGLANTSGGAFLTVQKAVNVVASLDLSTWNVTIQLGAGTYGAGASISGAWVGSGSVTITGDLSTPANVVIPNIICVGAGSKIRVGGVKFNGSTQLNAQSGGSITISGAVEFGAAALYQMLAQGFGSTIDGQNAVYTISGGAVRHLYSLIGGYIQLGGATITVSGTPAFSSAFADAQRLAMINAGSAVFSGAAAGVRYSAALNGAISVGGGGASFFPGSTGGSTATGGQYA